MSARSFKRKQFLIFAASAACTAIACAEEDPATDEGASGSGRGGTAGGGTGGSVSGSVGGGTAGSSNGGSSAGRGGASGAAGVSGRGGGGGAGGSGGGASGSANESGAGGEAGFSGIGGEGGSGSGDMCGAIATFSQTSNNPHDHIPDAMAPLNTFKMKLKNFVNGATAMAEFTLPVGGPGAGHVHKFRLTAQQIATLKGGGTVNGVKTYDTTPGEQQHATGHEHTYSITCVG